MIFMIERKTHLRGFTLVELIVVIAIIAILSAVSIAGFSNYIDRARFSNDTQLASQMTTILKNHLILNPAEELDAEDVRTIIESYNEGGISFTPSAKETGFFYLSSSDRIIAAKFEDATGIIEAENLKFVETRLLSDQNLDAPLFNSPEEIFGSGGHLLTTEDTPVAMVVSFIQNMASSGSRIDLDYQEALDAINDYQSNLFVRLFGNKISENLEAKVTAFMNYYHPDTTLYVDNVNWATSATNAANIQKAVVKPGISNIPSFGLQLTGSIIVTLKFPSSIKTAEEGAIPVGEGFFSSESTIIFNPTIQLKIDSSLTLQDVFDSSLGISANIVDDEPLVLRKFFGAFEMLTAYSVDLTELRNIFISEGKVITGYRLVIDLEYPRNTKVYIYTSEGLVGYATPYIPSPNL
jgi:prepilin-type N-terminal cleavage/methylation domain-containing protein